MALKRRTDVGWTTTTTPTSVMMGHFPQFRTPKVRSDVMYLRQRAVRIVCDGEIVSACPWLSRLARPCVFVCAGFMRRIDRLFCTKVPSNAPLLLRAGRLGWLDQALCATWIFTMLADTITRRCAKRFMRQKSDTWMSSAMMMRTLPRINELRPQCMPPRMPCLCFFPPCPAPAFIMAVT